MILLAPSATCQNQDLPNIFWFMSEDNSPLLGVYGNEIVHTPAMDKFGEQALVFDNAFANAPVCAPSRSTLITGMHASSLGSEHMRSKVNLPTGIRFFPQYLKEAGYFTSLRIKRDYNIPQQAGTWDIDQWWDLKDALKGRASNQPFFVFYNTWMTHEDKLRPGKIEDYFKGTMKYLGAHKLDSLERSIVKMDPEKVLVPDYLPNIPSVRAELALYYECMQRLDMEFALAMQFLKDSGELDNTIVIYTSDHGGVFGRSKRFTFETGLKIPMMMQVPEKYQQAFGIKTKRRTDQVVSLVDMAPTLLAFAGIEAPDYMTGKPIFDPNLAEDRMAYGFRGRMDESYDLIRTVRSKNYRYIRNFNPHRPQGQWIKYLWNAQSMQDWERLHLEGKLSKVEDRFFTPKAVEELYDVNKDPFNVNNLALLPEYQDLLKKMRQALFTEMQVTGDIGFIPEGEYFAASEKGETTYQAYADSQGMANIIQAARHCTKEPSANEALQYLKSETAAIRFWGATAFLQTDLKMNRKEKKAVIKALKMTLKDESGDVAATSAEALLVLGEKKVGADELAKLLSHQNPYVVLRVCNILDERAIKSAEIYTKLKALEQSDAFDDLSDKYIKNKLSRLLQAYEQGS
ncbi:sulfatase [Persicobacter diffluens]|uniref:Sulfatase n=2 Tax=Persicobacter diffluens TaxID=981 RepID=A0AAN4W598_9BACT|nr:sulfatase [Persicobacter diffluens]